MKYDYIAADVSFSDFDAIKRRLESIEAARKAEARVETQSYYARRFKRAAFAPKPDRSTPSSLASIFRSSSFQIGFASVMTAGMVGFFGLLASSAIGERNETAFYGQCRANDMNYVTRSRTYCADSQRFAHQLTDDGVTGRLSFDWKVNESALREAETQATHK